MSPQDRARKLLELVKQGKIVFFKAGGDGWDIIGPADTITAGASVTVSKADGSTEQVTVVEIMSERTVEGVAARTARFNRQRAASPVPAQAEREPAWYPVHDRQAAAVGGMLGRSAGGSLGYCHYCGLNLDRNGDCAECV